MKSIGVAKTRSRDSVQPCSRNRRLAIIVLGVMLLGSFSFAMLGTWNTWQMARQIASARETTGIVLSAEVAESRSRDSETGRTDTYYIPVVHYRYQVDGRELTSDQVYPGVIDIRGPSDKSRSAAEAIVRDYVPGTTTSVFYLPDEPQTAFLKPIRRVESGLFAVGGGLLAAAVTGLLLPLAIPAVGVRFALAAVLLLPAQSLTWLLWAAFLSAPSAQLSGSLDLLRWLLLAYVLICWTAFIAQAPPALRRLREGTFASLTFGTLMMSLSLFVLVPLKMAVPDVAWLRAFPWVGIVAALLALVLWMFGVLTVSTTSDERTGTAQFSDLDPEN